MLMSPVRVEIAEGLRALGPCSVAELAELIDRPADSLYRHVDLLMQAGLVVQTGFRKAGRNNEQLIDVAAEDFRPAFADTTGDVENETMVETARTLLRAAERAVRDAADARELDFSTGPGRNYTINYELSWLTPESFQEIRRLVREIKRLMDEGKKRREGRLYLSLAIATPVVRKRSEADRRRKVRRRTKDAAPAASDDPDPTEATGERAPTAAPSATPATRGNAGAAASAPNTPTNRNKTKKKKKTGRATLARAPARAQAKRAQAAPSDQTSSGAPTDPPPPR